MEKSAVARFLIVFVTAFLASSFFIPFSEAQAVGGETSKLDALLDVSSGSSRDSLIFGKHRLPILSRQAPFLISGA